VARVLLFGRLADIAGWREREIDPLPDSLCGLRDLLGRDDAALAEALAGRGVRAALDKALAAGEASLAGVREVAFMPPMSGG
jgi:molybdopterin synthase sulfur carrier subunit